MNTLKAKGVYERALVDLASYRGDDSQLILKIYRFSLFSTPNPPHAFSNMIVRMDNGEFASLLSIQVISEAEDALKKSVKITNIRAVESLSIIEFNPEELTAQRKARKKIKREKHRAR